MSVLNQLIDELQQSSLRSLLTDALNRLVEVTTQMVVVLRFETGLEKVSMKDFKKDADRLMLSFGQKYADILSDMKTRPKDNGFSHLKINLIKMLETAIVDLKDPPKEKTND